MKYWIIFISLISSLSCFSQNRDYSTKISKETKKIVAEIKKANKVSRMSYSLAKSSNKELIKLTKNSNPAVRCIAFRTLIHRDSVEIFPIVLEHINDNQKVTIHSGCIIRKSKVGDYFIQLVTPYGLTPKQITTLDSLLFYTPNKLNAKSNLLDRISITEQNYSRIRELAVKGNQSAVVKLAEYQKEQDINLILKNKDRSKYSPYRYTYKAIQNYPNPKFLPFLKVQLENTLDHDHYSGEWAELYKAITIYKNEESFKLLTIPFTKVEHKHIRKYHLEFIYCALREVHDTIYDKLLWNYWVDEEILTPDIYKYLLIKNPERAFKQTILVLSNPDNYYTAAICRNYSVNESKVLIENMIDLILNKDKELGIKLIKKNFEKINVHLLETFANKAMLIKDKSFVTPLFDLLENESNPHTYLIAARTLISYKDQTINQRIVSTKKINVNLTKGWGAKDFESLLKDNNIK